VSELTVTRARQLRRDMTYSERLLWSALRNRRVMLVKFRRQFPIGPYFADFAALTHRLVIEIDGPTHDGQKAQTEDLIRSRYIQKVVYQIMRFTNQDVIENLEGVTLALSQYLASDSTSS
jgi:very-short-patch-repair endonuclease